MAAIESQTQVYDAWQFPYLWTNNNYQSQFPVQEFQYFVVIDLEATCDKYIVPQPVREIIEFASVIVNGVTGVLEAKFQAYVKPTCNIVLTDFCKDFTGIQQNQVDNGVTLSEALLQHDQWLQKNGVKNTNFAVVTWGVADCKRILEPECQYKNITKPSYFNRWINLHVPFNEKIGKEKCTLKEAVAKAKLTWQGRPHSGLDDAINTAFLFSRIMQMGFKFSITSSLDFKPNRRITERRQCRPNGFALEPRQAQKKPVDYVPVCYYCGLKCSPWKLGDIVVCSCSNWTCASQYVQWVSI